MTLEERLCLARAGYSAQDIAMFEAGAEFVSLDGPKGPKGPKGPNGEKGNETLNEQDPKQTQEPDQKPAQEPKPAQEAEKMPAWAVVLEQSIKTLTAATQAHNVKFDDMGDPQSVHDAAQAALDSVYGGNSK